jgi:hypothetical protein
MPKAIETNVSDMLKAAALGLIGTVEFRKNAVKVGWELDLTKQPTPRTKDSTEPLTGD